MRDIRDVLALDTWMRGLLFSIAIDNSYHRCITNLECRNWPVRIKLFRHHIMKKCRNNACIHACETKCSMPIGTGIQMLMSKLEFNLESIWRYFKKITRCFETKTKYLAGRFGYCLYNITLFAPNPFALNLCQKAVYLFFFHRTSQFPFLNKRKPWALTSWQEQKVFILAILPNGLLAWRWCLIAGCSIVDTRMLKAPAVVQLRSFLCGQYTICSALSGL